MTIETIGQLAHTMGVQASHLVWLCGKANDMYEPLETVKKNGAIRMVYSPGRPLRKVQTWLLSNVLDKLEASSIAMAFEKGSSTLKAVEPHKANLTLVRIDLADFYGHIRKDDVSRVFQECGLRLSANRAACELCLLDSGYGAALPQGGIASPMIANRAMEYFDQELLNLMKVWGGVVTRYADDIYFSFSSSLGQAALNRLVDDVANIAERHGQEINAAKTHMMVGTERKSALGLVLDGEVSMFRKARRNFRAMCFQLELSQQTYGTGYNAALNKLRGMYAYMKQVDPTHAAQFAERFTWLNG